LHAAHRSEDIARPHGRGETEICVVRDLDGIPFILEWNHGRDGTKNLLARNPRGVIDVVENRRFDKEPAIERLALRSSAADRQPGLALPDLLILADAVELVAADERAHPRRAIQRCADLDRTCFLDHRVDELLIDGPLDQNAATGRAHFALVEEDT